MSNLKRFRKICILFAVSDNFKQKYMMFDSVMPKNLNDVF